MSPMTKNTPAIIEKAIDFMASTQAFREYLGQPCALQATLDALPESHHAFFVQRLNYYRRIYTPQKKSDNI